MVVLGHKELLDPRYFRDYGLVPDLLLIELADQLFCGRLLRLIVIEDRRAILRPHIRSLAIQCRRIMDGEEDAEQIAVREDGRVESNLNHLGVPGRPGADVTVARLFGLPAGVARLHRRHAVQLVKDRLAPETPPASVAV
jgi:hypothetical protein